MPNLPDAYDLNEEWLKEPLTGWVEKREDGKVVATIRAHYRVINVAEENKILSHEYYLQTTEKHFEKKASEAKFFNAIYKDIFRTHLSLLTQSTTYSSSLLEILLHFPSHQSELMLIARVVAVDVENELGRDVYHARLKVAAVNQNSITKMRYAMGGKKV